MTEMQNAIRLIRETVTWYVGGENIIGSGRDGVRACATLVTEQIVDGATSIYTFAPPPFGEIRLADEDAQEFRHYCHEPENRIEKAACAGTPRPEGTSAATFFKAALRYVQARRLERVVHSRLGSGRERPGCGMLAVLPNRRFTKRGTLTDWDMQANMSRSCTPLADPVSTAVLSRVRCRGFEGYISIACRRIAHENNAARRRQEGFQWLPTNQDSRF